MLTCEHCGQQVWASDFNDHLVIDHDIDVPQWGRPCPECDGSGDDVRRHWEAAPRPCGPCHGKGIV